MTKHRLPHLAQKAINTPLAIIPEKLELMLGIVGDRMNLGDIDVHALKSHADVLSRDSKEYEVSRDGVAILPVQGTLLKKTSGLWAMSGFSGYQSLQCQLSACMDDPNVRGILLEIDSPGGETAGCFELVDYIYSLRGQKPIYASADDLAASAAYAIASACDRIFVTRMGCVGSIGVFCLHADQSGLDEQMGVKFEYIYDGDHKVDGNPHQALSTPARKALQSEISRQGTIFKTTVARNRGVKLQKIIDTQAACFYPGNESYDALPLLADEVGTLDDACQALTEKITGIKVISVGAIGPYSINAPQERNGIMPAIPPHKTATSDSPWDGPKAKANLKTDGDEGYYRGAYAWQDPKGDATTKAAYKFIHHEVAEGGDVGAANLKGCSSGIGVLNGGRGGTVIPKADRKGVYNHLAKHIRDADEEPPDFSGETYVGKKVSFVSAGGTYAGVIEEEARDILFVKCEIAGEAKQFTLSCAECSLLDDEEFAAIAAENKGALPMAKKDAIAAAKDEECAAAEDMGPEMAGDEEDAEKNEDEKPEKPKKNLKSKDSKKSKASVMNAAKPTDDEDGDEDEEDDEDEDGDEDGKEADAEEPEEPEAKPKGPKHTKVTERHQYHEKITEKKGAKGGPTAEDLKRIATLCQIAGQKDLAADFIAAGLSVADVQTKLVDLRAKGSSDHQLSNSVAAVSSKSMESLISSATENARRNGTNVAAEVAKVIEANPKAYADYKRTLPDYRR